MHRPGHPQCPLKTEGSEGGIFSVFAMVLNRREDCGGTENILVEVVRAQDLETHEEGGTGWCHFSALSHAPHSTGGTSSPDPMEPCLQESLRVVNQYLDEEAGLNGRTARISDVHELHNGGEGWSVLCFPVVVLDGLQLNGRNYLKN